MYNYLRPSEPQAGCQKICLKQRTSHVDCWIMWIYCTTNEQTVIVPDLTLLAVHQYLHHKHKTYTFALTPCAVSTI